MQDITAVYYTAGAIPDRFYNITKLTLCDAIGGIPLIQIQQPKAVKRSHLQIYRNALEGVKQAKTKYVALCEDDVLYHKSHFSKRPSKDGVFAYNMNVWSIYTWVEPAILSYKGRRNLGQLICERDLFIEAIEERFAKYPDDTKTPIESWAEPGKYEDNLKVTERKTEEFYSDVSNVAFSHETALSFQNLGKRKKLGYLRAIEIPYWGTAEVIRGLYE